MTMIVFDARLTADGALVIPQEAVAELGIRPGDQVRVQIETAAASGATPEPTALERAIDAMTNRTPEQLAAAQAHAMETYKPVRTVPAGKTLADMVAGKWPGDETDAQVFAALQELS
jgi:bifunctional DNA-binding transcriptional regulator/antitoxin component of YhaV-PrlF toxin-antitoxin module